MDSQDQSILQPPPRVTLNYSSELYYKQSFEPNPSRIHLRKPKREILDPSLLSVKRASFWDEKDELINFIKSRRSDFSSQIRNSVDLTIPKVQKFCNIPESNLKTLSVQQSLDDSQIKVRLNKQRLLNKYKLDKQNLTQQTPKLPNSDTQQQLINQQEQQLRQEINVLQKQLSEVQKSYEELQTQFTKYKKTESMEAYFLKNYAGPREQMEKRQEIMSRIEDYLKQGSTKDQWDNEEDDRKFVQNHSSFSGVNQQLNDIYKDLKPLKDFSFLILSNQLLLDESNLEITKNQLTLDIQTQLKNQLRGVQNQTAIKIIERLYDKPETKEEGVQAWTLIEMQDHFAKEIRELQQSLKFVMYDNSQHMQANDRLKSDISRITNNHKEALRTHVEQNIKKDMENEKLQDELRQQRQNNATIRKALLDAQKELKEYKKKYSSINKINNIRKKFKQMSDGDEEEEDHSENQSQKKRSPTVIYQSQLRNPSIGEYSHLEKSLKSREDLDNSDEDFPKSKPLPRIRDSNFAPYSEHKSSIASKPNETQRTSQIEHHKSIGEITQSESRFKKQASQQDKIGKINYEYSEESDQEDEKNEEVKSPSPYREHLQHTRITEVEDEDDDKQDFRIRVVEKSPQQEQDHKDSDKNDDEEMKSIPQKATKQQASTQKQKVKVAQQVKQQPQVKKKVEVTQKKPIAAKKEVSQPKNKQSSSLERDKQSTEKKTVLQNNKNNVVKNRSREPYLNFSLDQVNDSKQSLVFSGRSSQKSRQSVHQEFNKDLEEEQQYEIDHNQISSFQPQFNKDDEIIKLPSKETSKQVSRQNSNQLDQEQFIHEQKEEQKQLRKVSSQDKSNKSHQESSEYSNKRISVLKKDKSSQMRLLQQQQQQQPIENPVQPFINQNYHATQNIQINKETGIGGNEQTVIPQQLNVLSPQSQAINEREKTIIQKTEQNSVLSNQMLQTNNSNEILPPEQITIMTRKNEGNRISFNVDHMNKFPKKQSLQYLNVDLNPNSKEIQTENQIFLYQIIQVIKEEILEEIESEKNKYSIQEYETLLKRTREIIEGLKRKYQRNNDLFMKADRINERQSIMQRNTSKKVVNQGSSYSPRHKMKVEEMFQVKVKTRVGGAGNFQRYYDVKEKNSSNQQEFIIRSQSTNLP